MVCSHVFANRTTALPTPYVSHRPYLLYRRIDFRGSSSGSAVLYKCYLAARIITRLGAGPCNHQRKQEPCGTLATAPSSSSLRSARAHDLRAQGRGTE